MLAASYAAERGRDVERRDAALVFQADAAVVVCGQSESRRCDGCSNW